MSTGRTYGVTDAPGVNLEITPTPKPPLPGAVGTTVFYGVFKRGKVGAVGQPPILCNNSLSLKRRRGGYVDDYFAPDACRDFLDHAKGTGYLYTVRVTDGTEVASAASVYGRTPPRGVLFRQSDPALNPVALSLAADWGGRAGGKRKVYGGVLALVGDVAETTLTTAKTMLTDEWAGATLQLMGVSSKTYTVLNNTSAGVITVDSDSTMATDIAADDPTNLYWSIELENLEANGTREAIGVRIKPRGQRRGDTDFGMLCALDAGRVWDLPDLSMVTAARRLEVANTVNNKADNYELAVTNAWTGGDNPLARPANWAGIAEEDGLATTTVQLRIVEWRQSVGAAAGKGFVDSFLYGTDVRPDTLTLTFTSATTYTVASTLVDDIPAAGALGANALHNLHPFLAGFTVTAGAVPFVTGDVIVIRTKPLPQDGSLTKGLLYPDGAGTGPLTDAAYSVPILSATHDTITVPDGYDLTAYAAEPEHAYLQTTVGPWNTDPGTFPQFTITGLTDELASVIADFDVPSAAALTATQLVAAWEAHSDLLWGEVQSDGSAYLGVQSTGALAYFVFTGGTAVGAGPSIFAAAGSDWGADGTLILLEYYQELGEGYDGLAALANSHMVSALDSGGSIAGLLGQNIGMPVVAAPGWTDSSIVSAMQTLGDDIIGIAVPDFPQAQTTEASAKTLVEGTWGTSDHYAPCWPSWQYVDRVETGEIDVLTPVTGKVCGLQAYSWSTFGMGKAPAGTVLELRGVKKWLKADDETDPDAEILNKAGIRALTRYGTARPVIWGDRIPGVDIAWLHKAACLYQIGRELLFPGTFGRNIFKINDTATWTEIKVSCRQLLKPHFDAGWFRRDLPGGFEAAVQIRLDSETTPEATRTAGAAVLVIGVVLPDTLEQLQIKLNETGVEL